MILKESSALPDRLKSAGAALLDGSPSGKHFRTYLAACPVTGIPRIVAIEFATDKILVTHAVGSLCAYDLVALWRFCSQELRPGKNRRQLSWS